jgi:hypothetical protein
MCNNRKEHVEMTIPEILDALKTTNGGFPREAVIEAIAQQEAITPELLRILEEDTANLEIIAPQQDYMAHIFAMYLLAQFHEPRAYPLLIAFFGKDKDLVDESTGDMVIDSFGKMLAATCNGDISLIKQAIEDETKDEYFRSGALSALIVLVKENLLSRDEVMEYIKELFRGKIKREFNFLWTDIVATCCDLYPGDVLPEIEQAYNDGLIDESFIGDMNYVNKIMSKSKDTILAKFMSDPEYHFINDTVKEMNEWGCFKEKIIHYDEWQKIVETDDFKNMQDSYQIISKNPAPVIHAPKVGRNDPCPCGSGEKYKRCCG